MSDLPLVLITGAANGIGRATARELARHGVRMGLIDIDRENLEALEAELRPRVRAAWPGRPTCRAAARSASP